MLFSQPELAAFLSATFECAWESVRPVPHATIDFGDGRTLESISIQAEKSQDYSVLVWDCAEGCADWR